MASGQQSRPAGGTPPKQGSGKQGSGKQGSTKQKAARMRAQQQQAERRRRTVLLVVVAAVLVGIIATVAFVLLQSNEDENDGGPVATPAGAGDSGIVVGEASAPVTIDLYTDYMCPACGQFEAQSGAVIDQAIDDGTAKVVYHTISFLDRFSEGTRYSTRSASAAGCAADADVFRAFNKALFENQPAEGTPGLSDEQLVTLGKEAGATDAEFETCVTDLRYEGWVSTITDAAFDSGVSGTPTVRVDGAVVEDLSAAGLQAAIDGAKS